MLRAAGSTRYDQDLGAATPPLARWTGMLCCAVPLSHGLRMITAAPHWGRWLLSMHQQPRRTSQWGRALLMQQESRRERLEQRGGMMILRPSTHRSCHHGPAEQWLLPRQQEPERQQYSRPFYEVAPPPRTRTSTGYLSPFCSRTASAVPIEPHAGSSSRPRFTVTTRPATSSDFTHTAGGMPKITTAKWY